MSETISTKDFLTLQERVQSLETIVQKNSETNVDVSKRLERIEANTQGVIEFFDSAAGAFKVLEWIGKAARPIGFIAASIAAVAGAWAALKGGIK